MFEFQKKLINLWGAEEWVAFQDECKKLQEAWEKKSRSMGGWVAQYYPAPQVKLDFMGLIGPHQVKVDWAILQQVGQRGDYYASVSCAISLGYWKDNVWQCLCALPLGIGEKEKSQSPAHAVKCAYTDAFANSVRDWLGIGSVIEEQPQPQPQTQQKTQGGNGGSQRQNPSPRFMNPLPEEEGQNEKTRKLNEILGEFSGPQRVMIVAYALDKKIKQNDDGSICIDPPLTEKEKEIAIATLEGDRGFRVCVEGAEKKYGFRIGEGIPPTQKEEKPAGWENEKCSFAKAEGHTWLELAENCQLSGKSKAKTGRQYLEQLANFEDKPEISNKAKAALALRPSVTRDITPDQLDQEWNEKEYTPPDALYP
jgi:hypothetical protein